MLKIGVFLDLALLLIALSFAAADNPLNGSCLCVTGNDVKVRDDAGHMLTLVRHGQCFNFNGEVLVKDDYKAYEIQDVNGHHRAWVGSEYVSMSSASHCTHISTRAGSFASGPVSSACLQCICQQESNCSPTGCHFDVYSETCGFFQINQSYWTSCGSPGESWKSCADDLHCASQCVQNYMKIYASHSGCPLTCETYARIHDGGLRGCRHAYTLGYWRAVQSQSGCSNVQ